ncbi:fibronectin type III domain-containing protein [Brachybacterium fresconis]|uniref:Fibronectin type-III domain-containing protein n=2 Tax=Brachybacterium fresconis TaxID=173363 RepID=A0ABS4YKT2_9MICO|nr:fibronectin type III domain-containing protein [Brachybacterium fresconis]MBP2409411.1 hypothetical protein [Brachybacterium fresconis]
MDALKAALADLKADPCSESYLSINLPFLFAIPDEATSTAALEQHGRKLAQAYNKSQNLPAAVQLKHLKSILSETGRFEDPSFWSQLSDKRREVIDTRVQDAIRSLQEEAPLGVIASSVATATLRSLGLMEIGVADLTAELGRAGVTVFADLEPPIENVLLPIRNTWERVRKHAEYRTIFHLLALKDGGTVEAARCIDELSIAGRRITPSEVTQSHLRTKTGRDTNAIQDAQKFLAELSRVSDGEQLRQIAYATVWADAAELSARSMPSRLIAESLTNAGLEEFDAHRLAASVRARGTASAPSLSTDAVRGLLAAGLLEEAGRTLGALKEEPDTAAEREQLGLRISELQEAKRDALDAYRRAEDEGDVEVADEHLRRAIRVDGGDDRLQELLVQLPLRAPHVRVLLDSCSALLSWDVQDETARYTVYRSTRPFSSIPAGTVVASDISGGGCSDRSVPAGEHVHYAVVATRPGGTPSRPGLTDIECLPAPNDLHAEATLDAVDLTWAVPKVCHSVVIELLDDAGRTIRHEAPGTTLHRFDGLTAGETYRVIATARYLTTAGPRTSKPASITVTPREEARPVLDLEVEQGSPSGGDDSFARWTAVPGFRVSLWAFPRGAAPTVGRHVTVSEARSAGGRELRAPVRAPTPDRFEARLPGLSGIALITPLLETDSYLLVGQSALAGSAPAVDDVRTSTFADHLRLTWSWPQAVEQVEVSWQLRGITRTRYVTPSRYRNDGGVYIAEPTEISDIAITTVIGGDDEQIASGKVHATYQPQSSASLNYTTKITRSLIGRSTVQLVITASSPVPAPCALGLFLSKGSLLPMDPGAGQLIQHIQADFPDSGTLRQDVDLGRLRSPFWIRLFSLDPSGPRLIDPPTPQLKG